MRMRRVMATRSSAVRPLRLLRRTKPAADKIKPLAAVTRNSTRINWIRLLRQTRVQRKTMTSNGERGGIFDSNTKWSYLKLRKICLCFRYYSNYNSENIDPFVSGSQPSRSELGTSTGCPSQTDSVPLIIFTTIAILVQRVVDA